MSRKGRDPRAHRGVDSDAWHCRDVLGELRESGYELVRGAYRAEMYACAAELARVHLVRGACDWGATVYLGLAQDDMGDLKAAERAFLRALRLAAGSQRSTTYTLLGRVLTRRWELADAERWFRRGLKFRPLNRGCYLELGRLLRRSGRPAIPALRSAAEAESERVGFEACLELALLHRAQGRLRQARHWIEKALALRPGDENSRHVREDLDLVLDELPKAEEAADPGELLERFQEIEYEDHPLYAAALAGRAEAAAPERSWAAEVRGWALESAQRYGEALGEAERALQLATSIRSRSQTLSLCGLLWARMGDLPRAERFFRRAEKQEPKHADSYVFHGGELLSVGRLDRAEAALRQGVCCAEGCVDEAWLMLGLTLRARRLYSEALESVRRAVDLDPDYAEAMKPLRDLEEVLVAFPEVR